VPTKEAAGLMMRHTIRALRNTERLQRSTQAQLRLSGHTVTNTYVQLLFQTCASVRKTSGFSRFTCSSELLKQKLSLQYAAAY
jgi:hypothetical protein